MILLASLFLATSRSAYDPATRTTGRPTPYIAAIPAHVYPMTASRLASAPQSAVEADYLFEVASGTDIAYGDVVTSISYDAEGRVPWPGDIPTAPGNPTPAQVIWRVIAVTENDPLLFARRKVYVKRDIGSGPMHV